jgi:2-aminoadipate transaminase
VAFVPGEGAYLDGRGRSSMRLNFSGSDEDTIREGVRRIGEVVGEQVALYGTLTGEEPARGPRRQAQPESPAADPEAPSEGGRVVQMPRRRPGEGRAAGP